jgi:hypothetical protein
LSSDYAVVDIRKEMDTLANPVVVALDLSKGFNSINHTQIIDQLISLGVNDYLLNMTAAFLKDRKMRVKIGSAMFVSLLLIHDTFHLMVIVVLDLIWVFMNEEFVTE